MTNDEEHYLNYAKSQLREQREQLDGATRSTLNRARQRALDELERGKPIVAQRWLPIGIAGIVCLVAAGLAFNTLQFNEATPEPLVAKQAPDVPNLDLMFADEGLEMLEDLDFYLWLESSETTAASIAVDVLT